MFVTADDQPIEGSPFTVIVAPAGGAAATTGTTIDTLHGLPLLCVHLYILVCARVGP